MPTSLFAFHTGHGLHEAAEILAKLLGSDGAALNRDLEPPAPQTARRTWEQSARRAGTMDTEEGVPMSLAELLPAVRALTVAEKAELVRIVGDELRGTEEPTFLTPGGFYDAGFGLFDQASCECAEDLRKSMEGDRPQP
ncbi:MAG: hypothetical protein ACRC33_09225 [Gemmataceae bacterium]